MIQEKDWLLRQIQTMIAAILNFLTHTGENGAEPASIEAEHGEQIVEAVRSGRFCQTEDWLMENRNGEDLMWMRLSVLFYGALNERTDEELERNGFSREEIHWGLVETAALFGLDGLL